MTEHTWSYRDGHYRRDGVPLSEEELLELLCEQQGEIQRLRRERDEARDAARWMWLLLGNGDYDKAYERWPWLEDVTDE